MGSGNRGGWPSTAHIIPPFHHFFIGHKNFICVCFLDTQLTSNDQINSSISSGPWWGIVATKKKTPGIILVARWSDFLEERLFFRNRIGVYNRNEWSNASGRLPYDPRTFVRCISGRIFSDGPSTTWRFSPQIHMPDSDIERHILHISFPPRWAVYIVRLDPLVFSGPAHRPPPLPPNPKTW